MRSWNRYGEKSGRAVRAAFSILGHERAGSSVRPSKWYTSRHRPLQELRSRRLVGYTS